MDGYTTYIILKPHPEFLQYFTSALLLVYIVISWQIKSFHLWPKFKDLNLPVSLEEVISSDCVSPKMLTK